MLLSKMVNEAQTVVLESRGDCEIESLSMDSRKKLNNGLFFCVVGEKFDAHHYAPQAIENGAVALVVTRFLDLPVPQVRVTEIRAAMSLMAAAFFHHPEKDMILIGVTGTKGKTTTTYLVKSILEEAGHYVGLIGTTGNMIGEEHLHGEFTTPEPIEFLTTLDLMRSKGVTAMVMEVSAHAIAQNRIYGIHFQVGCFTNFSQDHLDFFHNSMDEYFACKKSFFVPAWLDRAVVNADSSRAEEILNGIQVPCRTFGICQDADVFAHDLSVADSTFHMLDNHGMDKMVHMKLRGKFNVYNGLAAATIGLSLGIDPDVIIRGLEKVSVVPGRFEVLDTHTPYMVILDYSHSPDALENILISVREIIKGRLISLFGCGGNRDHDKRPKMGIISGEKADFSILTSDNPRYEEPMDILNAIEEGIKTTGGPYTVIENRREAIRFALEFAKPGDAIVLAGKGHETYQEIKGVKHDFDEKIVVQELLAEMRKNA